MGSPSDDLIANAALIHDPDGARIAGVVGCHLGDARAAEEELAPFRDFETTIAPVAYAELNSVLDPKYPRGALNYWKSTFLSDLSDEAIAALVTHFETCPSPQSSMVIEHLHGAATRVPVEGTAVPHRSPGYNLVLTSVWTDPAASDENIAWTRQAAAAMQPFSANRTYSNYLAAEELAGDPVVRAYGPNYRRLVEVKDTWDPTNLFHLNQNIRPSRG
jgi:berberine-like enzyme